MSGPTLKRTYKTRDGLTKVYEYDVIGGLPTKEYYQQLHKNTYVPQKRTVFKCDQIPKDMKKEILRLRSHRLGPVRIHALINDDDRFSGHPLGEYSIRKIIKKYDNTK